MKITCGAMVRCWDLHLRPCLREVGHCDNGNLNGHNPFSTNPPMNQEAIRISKQALYSGKELVATAS